MKILLNKKGELDVRNGLGWWSLIKEVVDLALIIGGGGILMKMPNVEFISLVFFLWAWSVAKVFIDTPMVAIWLIGKLTHKKKRRRKR